MEMMEGDSSCVIYALTHQSMYEYDSPVNVSKHLFRLQPVHDCTQSILKYTLHSSVKGKAYNYTGVFGNAATRLDISEPYTQLIITSTSLVAVVSPPIQLPKMRQERLSLPVAWMPWDQTMLQAYLLPPELPESELYELFEYAMGFVKRNNNCLLSILDDINATIFRDYKYLSGSTTLTTTPYEVYMSGQGVCQDFANLFICLARLLNIPARYRVGYIYLEGTPNQHASDTHAWVEVYMPRVGWVGFDPTHGCHEGTNHVRVASGRNYRDATPTSGTIYSGGDGETFTTHVSMIKISPCDLHKHF
jgi:transglutaminase-like putative cysteine protease